MPRPKSIVWKFFTRVKGDNDNKQVSYKCNYCGELYVNNPTCQRKHLEKKCLKYPQTVKELLRKERFNNRRQRNSDLSRANNDSNDDTSENELVMVDNNESLRTTKTATAANVMPPAAENSHVENTLQEKKSDTQRSTPKVLSLQEYFDFITPDKQERLDEKLSRAIYSSDCALSMLDNQY